MTTLRIIAASLLAAGASIGAFAAKPPLYDDFSGPEIDRAKWIQSESWRYTAGGKLRLGRWLYGGVGTDIGVIYESFSHSMPDSTAPKAFGVTIKVTDADTIEGCGFNPTPSRSRARLIAAYFNLRPGGPVPGDQTGDVLAQIWLARASDSLDPPGTLQVAAMLSECTNADCSTGTVMHLAPMGSANAGTAVTLQIDWDKKNNLFRFIRDTATVSEAPYTAGDGVAPAVPFVNVSLRNETANCVSGPRAKAGLAAEFDNVRAAR